MFGNLQRAKEWTTRDGHCAGAIRTVDSVGRRSRLTAGSEEDRRRSGLSSRRGRKQKSSVKERVRW